MSNMKKVQRSRMMITKSMLGQGYVVCFTDSKTQRNFCYPIDDFHDWLESNTNCLNTSSWKDDGVYNWHYVPQKYFDFLNDFEEKTIPADMPISVVRDYRPNHRIDDLRHYKRNYGHCLVDDNISEYIKDEESKRRYKGLSAWIKKKRSEYKNWLIIDSIGNPEEDIDHIIDGDCMDEEEAWELQNMEFIFYPNLEHYFEKNNYDDREYLIKILQKLPKRPVDKS